MPSRPEIDLKLQNLELKLNGSLDAMKADISDLKASVASLKNMVESLNKTVVLTAISVIFAIAGLNYTLLSNMLAAFESGASVSKERAAVQKQMEETSALLKKVEAQLGRQPKPPQK